MNGDDWMFDTVVVGGGISGSKMVDLLSRQGEKVLLLEKSRGLGGRLCTRYTPFGKFQHGAQFFTIRNAEFYEEITPYIQNAECKEWGPLGYLKDGIWQKATSTPRYVFVNSTSTLCSHWAKQAEVCLTAQVQSLSFDQIWRIHLQDGQVYTAKKLVLSMPLEQAKSLLPIEVELPLVQEWHLGASVMFYSKKPLHLPNGFVGGFVNGSPIRFVANQESKQNSDERQAWVLVLNEEWAQSHWKQEGLLRHWLHHCQDIFGESIDESLVEWSTVHFWKFAELKKSQGQQQWYPQYQLGLVGESFQGGRIEGAYLSAHTLWNEMVMS